MRIVRYFVNFYSVKLYLLEYILILLKFTYKYLLSKIFKRV